MLIEKGSGLRVINDRMKLDKGKQGCMQVGANFARTHAFASIHVVDQAEYNRQCSAGGAQPMCASLERQDALAAESAPSTTPDIRNRRANLLERRSTGGGGGSSSALLIPCPDPTPPPPCSLSRGDAVANDDGGPSSFVSTATGCWVPVSAATAGGAVAVGACGCRCSGDDGLEQSEAPKRRKEMARINGSTAHRRRAAIFFVRSARACVLCVRVVSIGCQTTLAGLQALTNDHVQKALHVWAGVL